mmetsp:Transcript_65676/g.147575  ORF Transcript_65676/g.147575 Transcript_65676/m.147575 type:complete len:437 (+) Transcript_65676:67-1377(+)
MISASMACVAAALIMGVSVASTRQDMILVDQASMIQLPLQKEAPLMPGRVANLQSTLPEKCATLTWATPADCDMSKKLVDFIISQKGGATGNDLDVAKRVAGPQMLVYGQPGLALILFDTDGSGNLSYAELRPVVEGAMECQGDENVAKFMTMVDSNADNMVSMPEIYEFGRACLVVRQFLRNIDSIAPQTDSGDLLPLLVNNSLHLPETDPENFKWHAKFLELSANYTAECLTVTWATEADCQRGRFILDYLVQFPYWDGLNTLEMARSACMLEPLLHVPDYFAFGMIDSDGDGEVFEAQWWGWAMPARATIGDEGAHTVFSLMDNDASGNVSRAEAYGFARGSLVLRHFISELDKVAPGKLKDGSSTLLDSTALNMAMHILDPPPVPKAKLAPGPKLLCIIGIMMGAMLIQWFCCAAKIKEPIEEDEPDKKEVK